MKYILKSKAKLFGSLSEMETYGTCKSGGHGSIYLAFYLSFTHSKCIITNVNVKILKLIK